MAQCSQCGISMGFFARSTICDRCSANRKQNTERALEDFQQQKECLLLPKIQEVKNKIFLIS